MRLGALVLSILGVALSARSGRADPSPPLRTTVVCEAPPGPGRFRCDVELRVADGSLSWADVEVVAVDDFLLPLRGRLGPRDASTHEADIYRWSLGFVAKGRGTGNVRVRVRAVVCHGDACVPADTEVSGSVVVGR